MNKRIIVIKEPVPGIWGIHRLYGQVKEKFNPQSDEELYVVFYNKSYTRLKLMHVDATGYDLTTRILFSGKFSTDGKSDNLDVNAILECPYSATQKCHSIFKK